MLVPYDGVKCRVGTGLCVVVDFDVGGVLEEVYVADGDIDRSYPASFLNVLEEFVTSLRYNQVYPVLEDDL